MSKRKRFSLAKVADGLDSLANPLYQTDLGGFKPPSRDDSNEYGKVSSGPSSILGPPYTDLRQKLCRKKEKSNENLLHVNNNAMASAAKSNLSDNQKFILDSLQSKRTLKVALPNFMNNHLNKPTVSDSDVFQKLSAIDRVYENMNKNRLRDALHHNSDTAPRDLNRSRWSESSENDNSSNPPVTVYKRKKLSRFTDRTENDTVSSMETGSSSKRFVQSIPCKQTVSTEQPVLLTSPGTQHSKPENVNQHNSLKGAVPRKFFESDNTVNSLRATAEKRPDRHHPSTHNHPSPDAPFTQSPSRAHLLPTPHQQPASLPGSRKTLLPHGNQTMPPALTTQPRYHTADHLKQNDPYSQHQLYSEYYSGEPSAYSEFTHRSEQETCNKNTSQQVMLNPADSHDVQPPQYYQDNTGLYRDKNAPDMYQPPTVTYPSASGQHTQPLENYQLQEYPHQQPQRSHYEVYPDYGHDGTLEPLYLKHSDCAKSSQPHRTIDERLVLRDNPNTPTSSTHSKSSLLPIPVQGSTPTKPVHRQSPHEDLVPKDSPDLLGEPYSPPRPAAIQHHRESIPPKHKQPTVSAEVQPTSSQVGNVKYLPTRHEENAFYYKHPDLFAPPKQCNSFQPTLVVESPLVEQPLEAEVQKKVSFFKREHSGNQIDRRDVNTKIFNDIIDKTLDPTVLIRCIKAMSEIRQLLPQPGCGMIPTADKRTVYVAMNDVLRRLYHSYTKGNMYKNIVVHECRKPTAGIKKTREVQPYNSKEDFMRIKATEILKFLYNDEDISKLDDIDITYDQNIADAPENLGWVYSLDQETLLRDPSEIEEEEEVVERDEIEGLVEPDIELVFDESQFS